ncbi:MAG TPA: hypothetical protein VIL34_19925 [Actinopolymorphaceae bacterium]|jgi:ABC-type transport system involved in multi-copper enzyme maturation permease subunit
MIDALRFESARIRTVWSTYWLAGSALVLCALATLAFVYDTDRSEPMSWQFVATVLTAGGAELPFSMVAVFTSLIGIFATGHEYRHGTILPTLTAMPRRTALLAAKAIVVAVASALIALASLVVCWTTGTVVRAEPIPLGEGDTLAVLAGYVVLVTLCGVLGTALGQLTRAIPGPIVIILMAPLVVEPLIQALAQLEALSFLRHALPYLPFAAGMQLVRAEPVSPVDRGSPVIELLSRWEGGTVFALFIGVVLVIAWRLFLRRDA